MTLNIDDYQRLGRVCFDVAGDKQRQIQIQADDVIPAVVEANRYLMELSSQFADIGFNLFESLGQRNISGFVGEVFSRVFAQKSSELASNPHPDGRPDLIDISTAQARDHLRIRCYRTSESGRKVPVKAELAPFRYGGIEVKATIGDLAAGTPPPPVGFPRHARIRSLTYWGHHRDCLNLLGLYYDYFSERNGTPQIVAIFHTKLEVSDWNIVSVGKADSKKTSNTSLTSSGRNKLNAGIVAVLGSQSHRHALIRCGVRLQPGG